MWHGWVNRGALWCCGLVAVLAVGCDRSSPESVPQGHDPVAVEDANTDQAARLDPDQQTLIAELEKLEGAKVGRDGDRIVHIDLRGVTGVDDALVRRLATLPHVRNLQVQGEAVTDASMPAVGSMNQLAALALQKTAVTDQGLEQLERLQGLRDVSLYGSPITDAGLDSLAKLPRLAKLRLRDTRITGEEPAAFAEMQALVDLELSEIDLVNEALGPIGQLEQLKKLNLWLTKVDDAGIAKLRDLDGLTVLNLDNVAGVTDRSLQVIQGMPELTLLHLGGTGVTDAGLPLLYDLKNLRTLFLTRTAVTPEGLAELREAMPWIERLEYDG